jgi:hypothetical protein
MGDCVAQATRIPVGFSNIQSLCLTCGSARHAETAVLQLERLLKLFSPTAQIVALTICISAKSRRCHMNRIFESYRLFEVSRGFPYSCSSRKRKPQSARYAGRRQ